MNAMRIWSSAVWRPGFAYVGTGGGTLLTVELPRMTRIKAGESLQFSIEADKALVFGRNGIRLGWASNVRLWRQLCPASVSAA
ncbi:MAG: hypothetical protein B7Z02_03645 [Rhodobacterales bacterium 32-67-9]|nr:MAG: hypothetical protein B7Z02_03645 [Rhodobacterales bacterium 32-67-9]